MDPNLAAWMIAGGPQIELASERRDREQLHAYLDSQRIVGRGPTLVERLRAVVRPAPSVEPGCCPA